MTGANDHKPGWKGDGIGPLTDRLLEEAGELEKAAIQLLRQVTWRNAHGPHDRGNGWSRREGGYGELEVGCGHHEMEGGERAAQLAKIADEAADVANFAMMIADEADALQSIPAPLLDEGLVVSARKLAADIMAAMRRARFPKEYADEAHDEFESLTLTPMLIAALSIPRLEAGDPWQPGVKIRWSRCLEKRPLAVVDLDYVTIASRFAPLSVTLKECPGVFPLGWFDNPRLEAGRVTEAMWGGLARDIMMWLDFENKTPRALFKHLKALGREIPQWLVDEPEMQALDHVPSKGTRCVIIYKAMQAAATNSSGSDLPVSESLSCFEPPVNDDLIEELLEALPDITGKSYYWGGLTKRAIDALRSTSPTPDSNALREALVEAREALQCDANKFWEYVIIHQGKKTPDGDEKAARNREMAERAEAARDKIDAALLSSDPGEPR